ncbi:MAG: YwiC-like family protein [Anaerolineales bacterium]|nr:YwiC-like family protein [Anaerolineales bacterium]
MQPYFKKQIFLPQDHGSWVFILSPLVVGICAGKNFSLATFYLIVAAMSAFMLRQPMSMAIKAYAGRRSKDDLPAALFGALVYATLASFALIGLIIKGFGFLLYLALPGGLVFAWHLWLVSRRAERKRAGVEVVATGVLSLAAPAAYWVSLGHYDPLGWWLWLLTWLQSAASIVYAYMRLEQREWKFSPGRCECRRVGMRAFAYTSFNTFISAALGLGAGLLPKWIFVPYLLQWLETLWGIDHPAIGWKPTRIGIRQLIVSILWTIAFIIVWQ